ncbi:MAG TPA: hypothetical protein DEA96_11270 [Leptospiraceae bacterium]|nr:hypothetical protein [Spirochaetaceae bacterium]HBS05540.1 hypothetical protein [Leptospiraceae bacterium]|tara:strand:- start:13337 stop:14317 length:981 start_codon:yes stop_codon:yes gene_type:complete
MSGRYLYYRKSSTHIESSAALSHDQPRRNALHPAFIPGAATLIQAFLLCLSAFALIFVPSESKAELPDSGLEFYELQRVFQIPNENLSVERSREIEEMWAYPENIRGRFDELVFRRDYSSAYYRRALSIFEKTRRSDLEFLDYQTKVYRTLQEDDDPRPMSAREKRDALRNEFAHKKIRHHESMAADYDRVLKLLDSGKAGPMEGANLELYLEALRLNIIHGSKGRMYSDVLWKLRRYFQLEQEAANQWPFQFYVASTLTHLYRRARAGQDLQKQYRLESLKDRYTLNYLELRYGRDSYQYKETFDRLRREAGPMHFLRKAGPLVP